MKQLINRKYPNWVFLTSLAGVYIEPIFLSLWLLREMLLSKIYVSTIPLYTFIVLIHGVIMAHLAGYEINMLLSQSILLFVTLITYNQMFILTGRDVELWFKQYLKFAFVISIVGIVDMGVFFLWGAPLLTKTLDMRDLSNVLRLKSCLLEPGFVVTFLAPAVTYILFNKSFARSHKIMSFTIFIAILLTFSSSMLMVFVVIFFIKLYTFLRKYLYIFLLIAISLFSILVVNLKNKNIEGEDNTTAINKVAESLSIASNATPYDFELLNASSYAQLTNLWIAFHAPYRIVGTGLGTHSQNYEKLYKSDFYLYGLCSKDAYSIFSRVLSEFGYIGVLLYLMFIYKCYNKKNIYSTCFLVAIIGTFVRGGNYTIYCIALFHFLYYHCRKTNVA